MTLGNGVVFPPETLANSKFERQTTAETELSFPQSAVPPRPKGNWKKKWRLGILFIAFACIRAAHPTVVSASKTRLEDGSRVFAYQKGSPVCIFSVLVFFGAQAIALAMYGKEEWLSIWQPTHLMVFGVNGMIFAVDDWLEMESLSRMHGAPYQILSQSKILITAIFMMPVKGLYQTRMQWMLLIALMGATSLYMCIVKSGDGSGSDVPAMAYLLVLLKVTFSCLGAVYADKYAKKYARFVSLPVQLAQLYFVRAIATNLLASTTSKLWVNGFFYGWDAFTPFVTLSFCAKGVSTYVILAILDAILKNMAECVAVLLIFFYDVFSPFVDFQFDTRTSLAVFLIVLVICAYVESKTVVDKAKNYDVADFMGRQVTP